MDIKAVRGGFPALAKEQVFFDNAGGSQVLGTVIDSCVCAPRGVRKGEKAWGCQGFANGPLLCSIRDYLMNSNVQLGATYETGKKANEVRADQYLTTAQSAQGSRHLLTWIHAELRGCIPSSSQIHQRLPG